MSGFLLNLKAKAEDELSKRLAQLPPNLTSRFQAPQAHQQAYGLNQPPLQHHSSYSTPQPPYQTPQHGYQQQTDPSSYGGQPQPPFQNGPHQPNIQPSPQGAHQAQQPVPQQSYHQPQIYAVNQPPSLPYSQYSTPQPTYQNIAPPPNPAIPNNLTHSQEQPHLPLHNQAYSQGQPYSSQTSEQHYHATQSPIIQYPSTPAPPQSYHQGQIQGVTQVPPHPQNEATPHPPRYAPRLPPRTSSAQNSPQIQQQSTQISTQAHDVNHPPQSATSPIHQNFTPPPPPPVGPPPSSMQQSFNQAPPQLADSPPSFLAELPETQIHIPSQTGSVELPAEPQSSTLPNIQEAYKPQISGLPPTHQPITTPAPHEFFAELSAVSASPSGSQQRTQPTPPAGPPPPQSYFPDNSSQTQEQIHTQHQQPSRPSTMPVNTPKPNCPGRNAVLTKYHKFYILKSSVLPWLDPKVQDLSAFGVCEACFTSEISRNPNFLESFEEYISPDNSLQEPSMPSARATCDFWLPAVKQTFQQCLYDRKIDPLIAVAKKLKSLPQCPGNTLWGGGELYTAKAIPNSTICVRCYELYLESNSFGAHFTKQQKTAEYHWKCEIGQDPGYIHNALVLAFHSPAPDFHAFARESIKRMEIPSCPGEGKVILPKADGMSHVYGLNNGEITFCEECYIDRLRGTHFESLFMPMAFDPQTSETTCDLASNLSKFLMKTSLSSNNLPVWIQGMEASKTMSNCSGIRGVDEETVSQEIQKFGQSAAWYHVNQCPVVEICPSCYLTLIPALNAEQIFTPVIRPLRAGVIRTCNFSYGSGGIDSTDPEDYATTLAWRGSMLRGALDIAYDIPLSSNRFATFISICNILQEAGPACGTNARGYKSINNRKFYGRVCQNKNDMVDCTVVMCGECWGEYVKDTPLNAWLGTDLTAEVYRGDVQKEGFCQPFSKNSKKVLRQAAKAGDFTIFARHWQNRALIREQTLPLIKLYQQQYLTQNMQKMSAMSNAMMVQGGAGILEAAGTDGNEYGNSVVGMGFHSRAGVDAAMMYRKADNMKWGDTSYVMKIAELEQRWKAVE